MFSGCLISLYIKMAVGKECLGLAENFEEMKDELTVNPLLSPPQGGGAYLCQAHLSGGSMETGGGLFNIWEGAGGLVNLATTMVSVFHKIKLEYKVETLKY